MNNHLSVDSLKRRAKRLHKEQGIPQHAALDKIARETGYCNWAHLQSSNSMVLVPRALIGRVYNTIEAYSHAVPWQWSVQHRTLQQNEDEILDDLFILVGGWAGMLKGGPELPSRVKPKTANVRPQPGKQTLRVPRELLTKTLDVLEEYARDLPSGTLIRGGHNMPVSIRHLRTVLQLPIDEKFLKEHAQRTGADRGGPWWIEFPNEVSPESLA